MPVAPVSRAMKVTCPSCGWHRTFVQRSDVILAPNVCEKCGNDQLQLDKASMGESLAAQAQALLHKFIPPTSHKL